MRNPKHIQTAVEREVWQILDGTYALNADGFKDKKLFDDLLFLFKDYRKNGHNLPEQSIFLGEYRYWLDDVPAKAERIFRERISAKKLESKDLTRILRKMIKRLEQMPDNSTFSTSELLDKCVKRLCTYNVGNGPSFELLDGEYFTTEGDICESLDWEMYDRFTAAACRHDFMIDCSNTAFQILGLPYNIPHTYRRIEHLLNIAGTFTESDSLCNEDTGKRYFAKTWKAEDGNTLTLLEIPAGTGLVRQFTKDSCAQIEVLSGRATLKATHFEFSEVYGEEGARWIDTGEQKTCNGKGGLCAEPDNEDRSEQYKASFTIDNIGDNPAIVLISRAE